MGFGAWAVWGVGRLGRLQTYQIPALSKCGVVVVLTLSLL